MKLRDTMILRMTEWLHTLVIFWCFYPLAVCFFWPEESGMEIFCMTGMLLFFPIVLSWYMVKKIRHLILYLGAGLIVSFGYGALNGIICTALGINGRQGSILSAILCLLLFFIRGKGKLKGEQAKPSPFHWICLALHYVLGALYKVPFYWHMAFYLFLLDVFLCFIFRFLSGYFEFLQEHGQSAGLPVKTMQKVVGIIFCFACMGLLIFTLPSLLYGKAPLSSLSFEEKVSSGKKMPESSPGDGILEAMDVADREKLPAGEKIDLDQPPGWLVFLSVFFSYLFCAGGVFAVLLLVCRACKSAGNYFASETEDEICFLKKEIPFSGQGLGKGIISRRTQDAANIRIRKIYKKLLHTRMRQLPVGCETPKELEEKAGLGKDRNCLLLHTCYEKARYSEAGCTEDEAASLKKQTAGIRSVEVRKKTERPAYAERPEIIGHKGNLRNMQSAMADKGVLEEDGRNFNRRKTIMEGTGNRLRPFERDRIFHIFLLFFFTLICIVIVYPLYYVAVASVTGPMVVNSGKALLYPEKLYLDGYRTIFAYPLFWIPYKNTIVYTAVGTLISLAATIPAGYVLSRKELVGRGLLNGLFIFTMFFSGGTIPLYLTVLKLGIYNTIWAMVLPTAVSVYNLLVCRSFFEAGIPEEVWEAAKVDGCTYLVFFFKFVLPLSKTVMGVMALFYATAQWNQYWNAIIYLRDEEKMPVQVQLTWMAATELKYCAVVVTMLPFLLIYPFFQKYFVQGVTVRSIKS